MITYLVVCISSPLLDNIKLLSEMTINVLYDQQCLIPNTWHCQTLKFQLIWRVVGFHSYPILRVYFLSQYLLLTFSNDFFPIYKHEFIIYFCIATYTHNQWLKTNTLSHTHTFVQLRKAEGPQDLTQGLFCGCSQEVYQGCSHLKAYLGPEDSLLGCSLILLPSQCGPLQRALVPLHMEPQQGSLSASRHGSSPSPKQVIQESESREKITVHFTNQPWKSPLPFCIHWNRGAKNTLHTRRGEAGSIS